MNTKDLNGMECEDLLLRLVENDDVYLFKQKVNALSCFWSAKNPEREALLSLIAFLDLTSLTDTENDVSIKRMSDASVFDYKGKSYAVAGICSYSNLIGSINKYKKNKNIRSVVVSAGFPHSQLSLDAKLEDIVYSVENGADEVDICLNRGAFLEGSYNEVGNEISRIRDLIKTLNAETVLKVILETGELDSLSKIMKASLLALESGADFIKTSTGKISKGADIYSVCVMLLAIRKYFFKHGVMKGLKVSGGVNTSLQALEYRQMHGFFTSVAYDSPNYFRIGCSRLLENIKNEINQ